MGKGKIGMLGSFGTIVDDGPNKRELCEMTMGYGVTQGMAEEGAEDLEADKEDMKAPGIRIFYL